MSAVLACDLGGTGFRAALVDAKGATICSHVQSLPLVAPADGICDYDPEAWWSALSLGAAALAESCPRSFSEVEAIAISAMTRTQVFVSAQQDVVRPAILWADTRADADLPALRARIDPTTHPEAAHLNAYHPLARLWWLKQREPQFYAAISHVLEPKDYLNMRLTGTVSSDPISMARLIAAARPAPEGLSLLELTDIPASFIPPISGPVSIAGRVQNGLTGAVGLLAGVPVVTMANDTWASAIGLGAMQAGLAYNLSGTTEVFGVLSETAATAEGLLSVAWGGGLTQVGGPSLAGGDTVTWLLNQFEHGGERQTTIGRDLDALLSGARAGSPLVFVPYLRGERVPHWDPALRGAWVGLSRDHRPADLAQAVLEGVAFLNRLVLERAETGIAHIVREVRFGGGGATNSTWCQIKADILNRPVTVTDAEAHGIKGAAVVAWTALGRFADLAAAQDQLVRVAHRYMPTAGRRSYYDRLFEIFLETDCALAPISHRLVALGAETRKPTRVS